MPSPTSDDAADDAVADASALEVKFGLCGHARHAGLRHTHHLDPVARVRPGVDVAPSADEPPVRVVSGGAAGWSHPVAGAAQHHAEPHRRRWRRNFRRVVRQRAHRKSAHAHGRAVVRKRQRAPHRKLRRRRPKRLRQRGAQVGQRRAVRAHEHAAAVRGAERGDLVDGEGDGAEVVLHRVRASPRHARAHLLGRPPKFFSCVLAVHKFVERTRFLRRPHPIQLIWITDDDILGALHHALRNDHDVRPHRRLSSPRVCRRPLAAASPLLQSSGLCRLCKQVARCSRGHALEGGRASHSLIAILRRAVSCVASRRSPCFATAPTRRNTRRCSRARSGSPHAVAAEDENVRHARDAEARECRSPRPPSRRARRQRRRLAEARREEAQSAQALEVSRRSARSWTRGPASVRMSLIRSRAVWAAARIARAAPIVRPGESRGVGSH